MGIPRESAEAVLTDSQSEVIIDESLRVRRDLFLLSVFFSLLLISILLNLRHCCFLENIFKKTLIRLIPLK